MSKVKPSFIPGETPQRRLTPKEAKTAFLDEIRENAEKSHLSMVAYLRRQDASIQQTGKSVGWGEVGEREALISPPRRPE